MVGFAHSSVAACKCSLVTLHVLVTLQDDLRPEVSLSSFQTHDRGVRGGECSDMCAVSEQGELGPSRT